MNKGSAVQLPSIDVFDRHILILTVLSFILIAVATFTLTMIGCSLSHGGPVTPWRILFCAGDAHAGGTASFLIEQAVFLLQLILLAYLLSVTLTNAWRTLR